MKTSLRSIARTTTITVLAGTVVIGGSHAWRVRAKRQAEEAAIEAFHAIATAQSIFREGDKEGGGSLDYGSLTTTGDRYFSTHTAGVVRYGEPIALGAFVSSRRLTASDDLRPRAPALLARPKGPDMEELPLEAMRVSTVLMATRARVLLDLTFSNPHAQVLEGTLLVRLPDGASPVGFAMFQGAGADLDASALVPPPLEDPSLLLAPSLALPSRYESTTSKVAVEWGELRPSRVVEAPRAAEVYDQVTERRVDPALTEWSGGNNFSTRVFPIPAKGRKRVAFLYDQTPRELGGATVVPLAVPAKLPKAFRLEVAAEARAYARARVATASGDVELATKRGRHVTAEVSVAPDAKGSFLLEATPRSAVKAGFASRADVPGPFLHARLAPKVVAREGVATGTAVFLLDTSLSQRTKLASSCARILREVLERDSTIERFQVVTFDVKARSLFAGLRKNTPEERKRTLDEVEGLWLEGATNLAAALDHVETTVAPDEKSTYFLLSDAQLTWGTDDVRELERAHPRLFAARWICYQVGDAPLDRGIARRLAGAGGRVVSVISDDAVASAALAHRTAPVELANVRVEGLDARDLVVAGAPRTLHPGQTLEVGFRCGKGEDPRAARIVLEVDGKAQTFSLADALPDDAPAARAWAELACATLLELGDETADGVAVALSQRFGIANRVASFLILETDAEYVEHKLEPAKLDLARLASTVAEREARRPVGAPDVSKLDARVTAFLASIEKARVPAWARRAAPGRGAKDERPKWPERLDPVAVWRDATKRFDGGAADDAVRVLSSIVEESPRDPCALRLAAFVLMGWGRYEEAGDLFARTRVLRPSEPQALLGEALALEAQGRAGEAALRYEVLLAERRDTTFVEPVALRSYARLLARLGDVARERAAMLRMTEATAAHDLVLFWNVDHTDVDLHVKERAGTVVWYREKQSPSGGKLHGDNTQGLGPELYTHPKDEPARVWVKYFGTRAVEGTVPSATLLLHARRGGSVTAHAAVLASVSEEVVLFEGTSD